MLNFDHKSCTKGFSQLLFLYHAGRIEVLVENTDCFQSYLRSILRLVGILILSYLQNKRSLKNL